MAERRSLHQTKTGLKGKLAVATAPPSRRMSTVDSRVPMLTPKEIGNNIKVAVRIRPKNEIEEVVSTQQLEQGKPELLNIVGQSMLMFSESKELAAFDFVFGPTTTQKEVFESIGLPMVEDVLRGYNSTIFTYGQTGSGKTFSMMGTNIYDEEQKGIIPRAATELFSRIETMDIDGEFTFKCSMVEIYKEKLNDLLNPEIVPLRIKEDPRRGIYVEGLKQICVANEDELMETIYLGEQMRTVASTQWNAVSSRSHQIFLLEVRQSLPDDTEKRGILNLVDLAGSEKVTYYGVTGNMLQETKKINLSLSALGNVIHALTSNSDHVPFRDSKLTRLLQESLGGNFKTAVLVAVSPCSRVIDESINSIKFAQRAKRITNKARVNIKESAEMYLKMIAQLKAELATALRENSWLKEQMGGNVAIPTAFRCVTVVSPSPRDTTLTSEPSMDEMRLETTPTPMSNKKTRVKSAFELSIEPSDEEVFSQTPKPTRNRLLAIESFPLFAQEGRRSIEMGVGTEDLGQISAFQDTIHTKTVKIVKLENELEGYHSRIQELEEKLQIALLKLAKYEALIHELREANEKLKSQNLKQAAEIDALREKEHSSSRLVKQMKKDLLSLEGKCKEISDLKSGARDPTVQEFAEYRELAAIDTCEEPEMEQDEDLLSIAYQCTKMPVDFLCMSSYTQGLQQVLATNSSISSEMRAFSLNSGLLAAAMINCGLAAVLHTLAWKSEVWKRKFNLAKHRNEYQKGIIESLESAIDSLHDSFIHLAKRIDKLEPEMRYKAGASVSKDGRGVVTKFVRKGRSKKGPDSAGRESDKSINFERGTAFMSYIEAESSEFSVARVRACDTTASLQKNYTAQLKMTLEETRAEVSQYEKLTQTMEKSLLEKCRAERESWSKCVQHLREVYEGELTRKHEEVIRLHEVLGKWVQRYLDSQSTLPCDLSAPSSPPRHHRPSLSLVSALEKVNKLSRLGTPIQSIEARSGDSPLLDDPNF